MKKLLLLTVLLIACNDKEHDKQSYTEYSPSIKEASRICKEISKLLPGTDYSIAEDQTKYLVCTITSKDDRFFLRGHDMDMALSTLHLQHNLTVEPAMVACLNKKHCYKEAMSSHEYITCAKRCAKKVGYFL